MRKFIIGLFSFVVLVNIYAEGVSESIDEATKNTSVYKILEGTKIGQELFINIIIEMERNNDTNYDIEHIINNYFELHYIDYIEEYKTHEWIKFIARDEILEYHYAFKTFLELMDFYIWKKQDDDEIDGISGPSFYEE
jgi:hypothetical protein